MATLKFNYGGTNYELVAKDTKITTPSIKVGNLYIPCFKGNIGEDVTYGDKIYTLSPLKVGDYRSACSEKDAYKPDIELARYISNGPVGRYDYTLNLDTRPKYLTFSAQFDNTGSVSINGEIALPDYIIPGAEILYGTRDVSQFGLDMLRIHDTGIYRSTGILLYEIDKLDPSKTNKINITITLENHSGPTSFIVIFYGAYQVKKVWMLL